MATTKKTKKKEKDNTRYVTEPDPNADYVFIAEYIRRKHKLDLEKDPQASAIYHTALIKPIRRGEIEVYMQGVNKFIDWNKYKNFIFKRNFQLPQRRVEKTQ